MTTITRDDVEYVTEIDAANHRGMIAAATLRNEITSIKGELKHHLAAFDWMDGPEGWTESCQRLAAFIDANNAWRKIFPAGGGTDEQAGSSSPSAPGGDAAALVQPEDGLGAASGSPPEWLEEVIETIGITDGVDLVKWHQDKDGDYIVEIEYGEEEMSFRAGTDGYSHGADYEGTIHDMTAWSDVQWWCAGELYTRLQRAKRKLEDLEANEKLTDSRP